MIGYCHSCDLPHKYSDYRDGKKIPYQLLNGIFCNVCGDLILWD